MVYFDSAGKQNTEIVLKFAREYAKAEGISDIVVASTTGETGAKAAWMFKSFNVVVATHHVEILTSTPCFKQRRKRFGTLQPLELIANALRLLGEGTKVCVEIVVMAADAGLIPVNNDVIAIAGTGRGADTALVIEPTNASTFFDLKIREIIAKPRNFK